jgi:arylsulfatase A-like enzyme
VAFVNASRGNPFCAYVAFNAVHYPIHAPDEYVRRFADLPFERRIYAAMLNAADEGIGEIRRALAANGELENTLIFLVGDNGATTEKRAGINQQYATAGSNGPFKGFKFSLFDGGMHVPGLMHWPARLKGGRVETTPVQSMDILPTALAAAGVPIPGDIDGKPLLDLLDGGKPPHDALFWYQGGQTAIRSGPWKLVMDGRLYDRRPDGDKPLTGEDALWLSNLDEDPGESRNLRRVHPNMVDELATRAMRWRESLPKENAR